MNVAHAGDSGRTFNNSLVEEAMSERRSWRDRRLQPKTALWDGHAACGRAFERLP
jgi:hypothetical protein